MGKAPRKQKGSKSKKKSSASRRSPKQQAQLRREPAERMFRIHDLLKAEKHPTCKQLEREFGASPRVVRRDISYMRDHFKLPIKFDFHRGGYRYTRHVDHFPGSAKVNPQDVLGLMVAQKTLAQYEDAPFVAVLQEARDRLLRQLSPEGRITVDGLDHALAFLPVGLDAMPAKSMESVLNALLEQRVLTFEYRRAGERISESRRFHPYHVFHAKGRWYVVGYEVFRKAVRTFVISHMQGIELSMERVKGAGKFNFQEYFKKSFGVMSGQDDWEVVVDFDIWATDVMRGRQWHPTQQITQMPDGSSRVRFIVGNIEEVLEWVLEWGMHAHVVRPAALRRRLRDIGEGFVQRYADAVHASDKRPDPHTEPEFPAMSRSAVPLEFSDRN